MSPYPLLHYFLLVSWVVGYVQLPTAINRGTRSPLIGLISKTHYLSIFKLQSNIYFVSYYFKERQNSQLILVLETIKAQNWNLVQLVLGLGYIIFLSQRYSFFSSFFVCRKKTKPVSTFFSNLNILIKTNYIHTCLLFQKQWSRSNRDLS